MELIDYVTDLVLNSELDIDQVKQKTIDQYKITSDQFEEILSQIPELNS